MQLRPKTLLQKFTAGDFPLEVLAAVVTSSAAILNGCRSLRTTPPDNELAIASFVIGAVGLAGLLWRAFKKNRDSQGQSELHAIDGILHALFSILTENQNPETHGLRVCLFVPHPKPETVHQITDYVATEPPHGRGRNMSSRCGVVGRAMRSGQAQFDRLPKNATVIDHLVAEHGFDRGEAATMRDDRRSWAAIPIGYPGKVVAVIYLDCKSHEFFGKNGGYRRKVLEAAIPGVASFIANR